VPTRWIGGGIAFNIAVQFGATGDDRSLARHLAVAALSGRSQLRLTLARYKVVSEITA